MYNNVVNCCIFYSKNVPSPCQITIGNPEKAHWQQTSIKIQIWKSLYIFKKNLTTDTILPSLKVNFRLFNTHRNQLYSVT